MSVSAGMVRVSSPVKILSTNDSRSRFAMTCVSFCCGRVRSVLLSVLSPRQLAMVLLCFSLFTIFSLLVSYSPGPTLHFIAKRSAVDIKVVFNTSFYRSYCNTDDVPPIEVSEVSCQKLFADDEQEVEVAGKYHQVFETNQRSLAPSRIKTLAQDCKAYKSTRGYMLKPANQEEEEFPLAFSILIHKDPGQVERLLRAIYRPQNYYCIHVDKKSEPDVHGAMRAVAGCFDNVFIASRKVTVSWGKISVVEAETTCMQDLMQYTAWKYFINLGGQEFPIRTNSEIVKILKQYRGANDIPGVPVEKMQDAYIDRIQRPRVSNNNNVPREKRSVKKDFQHPIDLHFGTSHVTATRDFVGFLLNKTVSRDLLEWLRDTRIPDETYFSTLAHDRSLEMPGGYTGDDGRGGETLNRFKIWRPMQPCSKFDNRVCVLGLVNLPEIVSSKSLFANKFSHDFQPLAFDCLEERIFASTKLDIRGWKEFDSGFYKNQPFAVNALRPEEDAAAAADVPVVAAAAPKQKQAKTKTAKTKDKGAEQQAAPKVAKTKDKAAQNKANGQQTKTKDKAAQNKAAGGAPAMKKANKAAGKDTQKQAANAKQNTNAKTKKSPAKATKNKTKPKQGL